MFNEMVETYWETVQTSVENLCVAPRDPTRHRQIDSDGLPEWPVAFFFDYLTTWVADKALKWSYNPY